MSDQAAPKKDDVENNDNKDESKKKNGKGDDDDDDEEQGYTCGKCWNGYCACVVAVVKGIYNCIVCIKDGVLTCCASWWYPLKERCSNCSDCCDKKMNPYKDPYYKEYDSL